MRTKIVKRYYCDFCKRAGQSAFHMRRHEAACTANPKRVCRMCEAGIEVAARNVASLVGLLIIDPDTASDLTFAMTGQRPVTKVSFDSMWAAVDHCPACALWVLRAAGAYCPGWDYASAKKDHWTEVNNLKAE